MSSSTASRRAKVPRSSLLSTPSSSPSPLSFDASVHTLVQLKAYIASHQTAVDEQKQREEEEGTAAKRNRAYFERQVRRIQQRLRRLEEADSIIEEDEEDEKAAPVDDEEAKTAPVVRHSTSQRRSHRRSASPAATATHATADRSPRHTVAAIEHNPNHDSDSEQSGASGRKRRRSTSRGRESSKHRPTKKQSDKPSSTTEQCDDATMEVEADDCPPLSPPRPPPVAGRLSAASPSSAASTAYVDPSLLTDFTPSRRTAAHTNSPRSPGNVFQTEQSVQQLRRAGSVGRPNGTTGSSHKPIPQGRPSYPVASPATASNFHSTSSVSPSLTSPSSGTGLRHRLSSFIPHLFNHQPTTTTTTDNQHTLISNIQPSQQQLQQQQRAPNSDELKRMKQLEEESKARLAAVQSQLEAERRAKEEAEKERRRLAEQVQQLESERKKEVEQRTPSRPPQTNSSHLLAYGQPPTTATSTNVSAAARDGAREKDELTALKVPTGLFAQLSAFCRRATKFIFRLSAVMIVLLVALMVLQSSPVRRLLGLERDTLFCPSASLPSSVDGMYHGALVRLDGNAQCTVCPADGWCDEFGHLQCDDSYVRQNNLCVKDSAWLHRALFFKEQAMTLLRDQAGRYECGDAVKRGLTGKELSESMKFVRWWEQLLNPAPRAESDKVEATKQFVHAMRLIEQDTRAVNVTHKAIRDEDILHTTYAAVSGSHSLLCSLRLTAWQNKGKLLLSGLVWCAAYYLYTVVQRWLWRRRIRPLLRQRVVDLLQQRAPEAVAIEHVRDELWQGQDSTVWEWVEADINDDSRVEDRRVKSVNSEIHRHSWLWAAPINRTTTRRPDPLPLRSSTSGGSREKQTDVASSAFNPSNVYAAARDTLPGQVLATSPAVADAMFAPPNAAFSPSDLSAQPPAAVQGRGGRCVVC